MSIEESIVRLAMAVESLTNVIEAQAKGVSVTSAPPKAEMAAAVPAAAKVKKPAPAPAAAAAPAAEDFLGGGEASPEQKAITPEALKEALKKHAAVFKAVETKKLMIAHGADKATPLVANIPVTNYGPLMAKIEADLKAKAEVVE